MDHWRRESESASPPTRLPPSAPPPSSRQRSFWPQGPLRRAGYPAGAEALAALAGGAGMLLILLAPGWPPPVDPVASPQLLLPVVVPALFAALARMPRLHVALTGGIATIASLLIYMIVVPVWGVLQFLECWASWLSDC